MPPLRFPGVTFPVGKAVSQPHPPPAAAPVYHTMMDGLGWLSRPDKPHHPRDKRAEVIAAFSGVNCQRWGYERVNIRSLEWSTKAICSLLHVTCVENKVEPEEAIARPSRGREPHWAHPP